MKSLVYTFAGVVLLSIVFAGTSAFATFAIEAPYGDPAPMVANSVASPPVANTLSAQSITSDGATLRASVNPNGFATTAWFDWGTSPGYGNSTSAQSIGSGTSFTTFSKILTGLTPRTTYHFRVMASNSGGSSFGENVTFQTLGVAPGALTFTAFPVTRYSAGLRGNVNIAAFESTYVFFAYGTDSTMEYATPSVLYFSEVEGEIPHFDSASGLEAGQRYYYRLVAENKFGTTFANIETFTTLVSGLEYEPDDYTVALYHFNEPSGTFVQDYSGRDNHGYSVGSAEDGAPIGPGVYGYGRNYNLFNDAVLIEDDFDFDFPDAQFTLEAWVQPLLSNDGTLNVVSKWNEGSDDRSFKLAVLGTGQIELAISADGSDSTVYYVTTEASPAIDNVWHHIAATVNLSTQEILIYHNGIQMATSPTGTFPATMHSSSASVIFGSVEISGLGKSSSLYHCGIDEVRISETARLAEDFHIGGNSISGTKYNDANANGKIEEGEYGLEDFQMKLYSLKDTVVVATVSTDQNGKFIFFGVEPGEYFLYEEYQYPWIQTYPQEQKYAEDFKLYGFYYVNLEDGQNLEGYDFANFSPDCYWVGGSSEFWDDGANWSCGHAPADGEDVSINTDVTITSLPSDSIGSLHIADGGQLHFETNDSLNIWGPLTVDDSSSLSFIGSGHFKCYDDFIVLGDFDPGQSTFEFLGTKRQILNLDGVDFDNSENPGKALRRSTSDFTGNYFYNLTISSDSTFTLGNVLVENQLLLNNVLHAREQDTVIIESDNASDAITGTGMIEEGSIRRNIAADPSLQSYRFESEQSNIEFNSGTSYPSTVTMNTDLDPDPRTYQLYWEILPSTVDTVEKKVTATNVDHLSKWTLGKPGPGLRKSSISDNFTTAGDVDRIYTIHREGGSDFNVNLTLRYDAAEVNTAFPESLVLLRGPYVIDTVFMNWNLLSLPVVADDPATAAVFPGAISSAYAYEGAYVERTELVPGEGIWVKFGGDEIAEVLGDELLTDTVEVESGWNMIGSLTLPVLASSVTSDPPGIVSGSFFGYRGGYRITEELEPLRGYWVKVSSPGVLILDAEETAISAKSPSLNEYNYLTISDGIGEQRLYFGNIPKADRSRFDLPPLPPAGIFDARFGTGRMLEIADPKEDRTIPVAITSSRYPVTITWEAKATKGSAVLVIEGKEYAMNSRGSAVVDNPDADISMKLLSGSSGLPTEFALYQNYPNPFNPVTTIMFDLPKDELVTLTVYNLLGQEVASLAQNAPYVAGRHQIEFSTTGLSSGVYLYKLNAGSFRQVRKMILTK